MKKTIITAFILCLAMLMAGVDITLASGKVYSGTISEAVGGMVVLMDGKVLIRIPAAEIKKVTDGTKDLTVPTLAEALSLTKQDSHFLTLEDYFVSDVKYEGQSWIRAWPAKMLVPATPATGFEAEFLNPSGESMMREHFYKTRIAMKEELRPGTLVICLDAADNDIYRAPANADEARFCTWWLARVTDTSEAHLGYIMVGSFKVALNAIRLVTD